MFMETCRVYIHTVNLARQQCHHAVELTNTMNVHDDVTYGKMSLCIELYAWLGVCLHAKVVLAVAGCSVQLWIMLKLFLMSGFPGYGTLILWVEMSWCSPWLSVPSAHVSGHHTWHPAHTSHLHQITSHELTSCDAQLHKNKFPHALIDWEFYYPITY